MDNWSKIEYVCTTKLGTPLNVLDGLEFWRVEQLLANHQEAIDQERKQQEKQEKEQNRQAQSSSVPGMKVPKMNIPNIKIPTK